MNYCPLIAAYEISIFGGGLAAWAWVIHLKKTIDPTYNWRKARNPTLDWSLGVIERGGTTTLLLFAPSLAPPFIGGWMALKFAANWEKREFGPEPEAQQQIARHRLTGLVGSAISFAFAILGALLANPSALKTWAH